MVCCAVRRGIKRIRVAKKDKRKVRFLTRFSNKETCKIASLGIERIIVQCFYALAPSRVMYRTPRYSKRSWHKNLFRPDVIDLPLLYESTCYSARVIIDAKYLDFLPLGFSRDWYSILVRRQRTLTLPSSFRRGSSESPTLNDELDLIDNNDDDSPNKANGNPLF